jgi:hypothetical protein
MANFNHGLTESGWKQIAYPESESLLDLARQLGTPVPSRSNASIVDRLVPTEKETARSRSMSRRYGVGAFPFHTDSANMRVPPRWVLLRLAKEAQSDRATLLHDFWALPLGTEILCAMCREVWLVNGTRPPFYSSILNRRIVNGSALLRFDSCCMRPAHPNFGRSAKVLEETCANFPPTVINWYYGRVLVLDNWRMLHARADGGPNPQRILERVLVR